MVHLILKLSVAACLIMFFLILSMKNLKYGIVFLILSMPFYRVLQWLMQYSDVSKYWSNIIIVCMFVAAYSIFCISLKHRSEIKFNKLDLILILFLIHGLIVTFITYNKQSGFTALNGFRTYFFGGIIYFLFRMYVKKKDTIRYLSSILVVAFTIIGIELLLEFVIMNILNYDYRTIPWLATKYVGTFVDDPERLKFGTLMNTTVYRPFGLLGYVHYTAYVVGMGVLMLLPFAWNLNRGVDKKLMYFCTFYLLLLAIVLSTTKGVVFGILLIMIFLMFKHRRIVNLHLVLFWIAVFGIFILMQSFQIYDYMIMKIVNLEDGIFRSFYSNPFWNLPQTNPFDLLFGRGYGTSGYERIYFGKEVIRESGFHFNQISDQIHILFYMNHVGIVGGILFVLQAVLGFKMGLKAYRNENDPFYKNVYIGLALCPLLLLITSVHILQSDVVMQFFNYAILGIIGSLKQVDYIENTSMVLNPCTRFQ